jgi:hypothetical protein
MTFMAPHAVQRFAPVREVIPSAFLVWRLGSHLVRQAGTNPAALRWARIGAAASALAGVAAILVGIANSQHAGRGADDKRLEQELEDTFPASDPPAVTRAGGTS